MPDAEPEWPAGGGNHRLVVTVDAPVPPVVKVGFERRWRDPRPPGPRGVLIRSAAGAAGAAGRDIGRWGVADGPGALSTVCFEPLAGPGRYEIYVLPVDAVAPAHYPADRHTPLPNPDPAWLEEAAPDARPIEPAGWEHRSPHHAWDPMEWRATEAEAAELAARWSADAIPVFGEGADRPVRLRTAVPTAWLDRHPTSSLSIAVRPGGRALFQLGVWASGSELGELRVEFPELSGVRFTCFNAPPPREVNVRRPLEVAAGEVLALWCGVEVDAGVERGSSAALIEIAAGHRRGRLPIEVMVGEGPAWDAPVNRLWWLHSDRAVDAGPTARYTRVSAERTDGHNRLSVVGRQVELGALGLPSRIVSSFDPVGPAIDGDGTELLNGPVHFEAAGRDGTVLAWEAASATLPTEEADGSATWSSQAVAGRLDLAVRGRLDYDGTLIYHAELHASEPVELADFRLRVPMASAVASYAMGLGVRGGKRTARIDWAWNTATRNQDAIWVGVPHAGLQLALRDEQYVRPLNTNFYARRPLVTPESWVNGGRGRVSVDDGPDTGTVEITATSGPRRLEAGQRLRFDFRLTITPFKPVDMGRHFARRYWHRYVTPDEAVAEGATTITLHHATPPNPFLNYPLAAVDELRRYVAAAHQRGLSVRVYNTIRELSTRAPELWAMLQLGDELFFQGDGGGESWLQEHLDHPYLAGWYAREVDDTSLIATGAPRAENFYVETLAQLGQEAGVDGLYLDDVAFDRETMKRVRHVIEATSADPDIDLHSANQFNQRDGFASSANLYLELMPYLDRLWFGEYFDYQAGPDYWLIEVSGLPFGLTGEMLQDGGNPWRGMLYGMSSRLGNPPEADPRPLWKLWDRVGLRKAQMHGYWVPDAPVRTGRGDVPATAFVAEGRTLVAVASWAAEDVEVDLDIDWCRLGLEDRRIVSLPAVDGLQAAVPASTTSTLVKVPAGQGAWVVLGEPIES